LSHSLPKEEDDDDDDENSLSGSPSSCLNPQISLTPSLPSKATLGCALNAFHLLHASQGRSLALLLLLLLLLKVLSSEDSWACSFGGRANVSATAEEFCVFVRFESHRGGRRRTTNPAYKDGESVEIVLWNSGNGHGTVRSSLLCSFPSSYATAAASNCPR
jgi:hypothetical protein